ncbi:MAG TPA: cation diffusion facilitator family transporter [Gemmatimonadaceae bacterium]|nr:cation diffusion facilitator family transporter [Gemmatimonadaceae bacterium]
MAHPQSRDSHPHSCAADGADQGHDHAHGHGQHHAHGHGHLHASLPEATRALRIALGLTMALLVAEVIGGLLSNSLALLADAGHMLTDAGALGLSLFVAWMCRQPGPEQKTYGYLRWEILAALINGATLLFISAFIVWEAAVRFRHPEPVASGLMLGVAIAGLVVNGIAARVLHGAHDGSLNMRGAYLHVLGDLLASLGTVAAAVIVRFTGWLGADPAASLLTTLLIVNGAWRLVREAVDVLLEAAPPHIALEAVRARLASIDGVESVHDLHVWTVASGVVAMSAHLIVRQPEQHQEVLERAHDHVLEMGIQHVTVQLERREMYERELHLHP